MDLVNQKRNNSTNLPFVRFIGELLACSIWPLFSITTAWKTIMSFTYLSFKGKQKTSTSWWNDNKFYVTIISSCKFNFFLVNKTFKLRQSYKNWVIIMNYKSRSCWTWTSLQIESIGTTIELPCKLDAVHPNTTILEWLFSTYLPCQRF